MIDKVSQLSHRIFNTSVSEQRVARESNPFSQSNFQKNILMEDVFESSSKKNNITFGGVGKINAGTKRIYSTFVGSINDFSKRFYDGIETIKEFCKGVGESIAAGWNKIAEIGSTEIHPLVGIKNGYQAVKGALTYDVGELFNVRGREVAKMAKMDPHTELKPMLIDSIEALQKELSVA